MTTEEKSLSPKCFGFLYHEDKMEEFLNMGYKNVPYKMTRPSGKSVTYAYQYYGFMNYDVLVSTSNSLSFIEQLYIDLEMYKPAVLIPTPLKEKDNLPPIYESFLFSNSRVKFIHRSLMHYFFPIPSWIEGKYGFETYLNVKEIPLKKYVVRSPNLFVEEHFPFERTNNQFVYERCKSAFKEKLPDNIDELIINLKNNPPQILKLGFTPWLVSFLIPFYCGHFNLIESIDYNHACFCQFKNSHKHLINSLEKFGPKWQSRTWFARKQRAKKKIEARKTKRKKVKGVSTT